MHINDKRAVWWFPTLLCQWRHKYTSLKYFPVAPIDIFKCIFIIIIILHELGLDRSASAYRNNSLCAPAYCVYTSTLSRLPRSQLRARSYCITCRASRNRSNRWGSVGKICALLMLVTLSGAIESISEFCLPSRIRHGAGDEVLYPVIVFVVSIKFYLR